MSTDNSATSSSSPTVPAPGVSGIIKALNACMREIGHIAKDRQSAADGKYWFRGIDDVYAAVQPVFAKHGVVALPQVVRCTYVEAATKNGGVKTLCRMECTYVFYALDGSSVSATTCGEGMDSSDKATAKAQSIAYKYAMFQVLAIPCEEGQEDRDPDYEKHDRVVPTTGAGSQATGKPAAAPSEDEAEWRATYDKVMKHFPDPTADNDKLVAWALWASNKDTDKVDKLSLPELAKVLGELVKRKAKQRPATEGGN